MNQKEIWKDIKGFESLYQISNLGRVKSLKKILPSKCGSIRIQKDKILKQGTIRGGYKNVSLCNNGKAKNMKVHRLVLIAFKSNPQNKPQGNHKDGIKSNNQVENLEWATQKENIIHGYKTGLFKLPLGKYNHRSKPVIQLSIKREFIEKFDSQGEAERHTGILQSGISRCCIDANKTAGGFKWKYEENKKS